MWDMSGRKKEPAAPRGRKPRKPGTPRAQAHTQGRRLALLVLVEAGAGLPAQAAGGDQFLDAARRLVRGSPVSA